MHPCNEPAAICREMEERFQAENEILTQMMQGLDALAPPAQIPPVAAPSVEPTPAMPTPEGPQPATAPLAPPIVGDAPAPTTPLVVPHAGEPMYERFKRQKPPCFEGSPDPVEAEDWLKKIQCIFEYMHLEDHERVACAVNQLEKEALCWWEYMSLMEGNEGITWNRFVECFYAKYLGEAQIAGKIKEFMELKQGNLTVAEYAAKFSELARFSLAVEPINDARKRKFMLGLNIDVVKQIDSGSQGSESYANAVQRTLRNESWDRVEAKSITGKGPWASEKAVRATSIGIKRAFKVLFGRAHERFQYNFKKKKFGRGSFGGKFGNKGNKVKEKKGHPRNGNRNGKGQSTSRAGKNKNQLALVPQCLKCKKSHVGSCHLKSNCFTCGQEGHYARDCPNQSSKTSAPTQTPEGRPNVGIYNFSKGDVDVDPRLTNQEDG